jgi:3-isopropylmalate/(R)-2-methylmalate dehydratase small subunit
MAGFPVVTGTAVAMLDINIDTDRIMPGLAEMGKGDSEYGAAIFANERYLADGSRNPDFILNREPWSGATILLAGRNFGCGSSRESAPLGLKLYGFRAIIAPSFGGIFQLNALRNGIVAVELPAEDVERLADASDLSGGHATMSVDLEAQTLIAPDGEVLRFRLPERPRRMLLQNLDEIGLTLSHQARIDAFRATDRAERPWAYAPTRR